MSDKIRLRRDLFAGHPRLTFINPADGGDHVPHNKRFRPRDSWANAEFIVYPAGGSVSITLSEGFINDAGNGTSRAVGMTLPDARARELFLALADRFAGDVNLLDEMKARGLR